MAAAVPAADKASDLMQKLSLEPKSKTPEVPAIAKKNSAIQPGGRYTAPIVQNVDPNMYYYSNGYTSSYYYGGHDGTGNWDYSRYLNHGVEMATGYYGDMYGYGYPYGAYPYTASPTMGPNCQNYQYPAPYFQPPSPAPYNPPNQTVKANGSLVAAQKPILQNSPLPSNNPYNKSLGVLSYNSYPWSGPYTNNTSLNGAAYAGTYSAPLGRNNSSRPFSYNSGLQNQRATTMMVNGAYMNRLNGLWGYAQANKCKPRGRGSNGLYGVPNVTVDGLSELNRGPRAVHVKSLKGTAAPTPPPSKEEQKDSKEYNREDFEVEYSDAKFFIIKSYSEDDIHKSVKYGVWASTQNGNRKLDSAYREATGPVFLFFSVNTSGQFVGVAEMTSGVDFEKSVGCWQQDKWTGCFDVKWRIVKDVPNGALKHIILVDNENKPVTNSRDTQEVGLDHGVQMLKIFKGFLAKTCIFDDFEFYETRQKLMQEKRAKQQARKVDAKNEEIEDAPTPVLNELSNVLGNGC